MIGVEAEGWWSGIRTNTGLVEVDTLDGDTFSLVQHTKNRSDFAISGRAGITFDRTWIYGKAGWVWGNFRFDSGEFETGFPIFSSAQSGTLNGLLVGIGVEHAFTWAPNWTIKMEYDYIRYGSKSLDALLIEEGTVITGETVSFTQHADKQIIKVGFNYLFNFGNWGAPVVAKY